MANIINNNFQPYKIKINRDEYWDLTLNKDMDDIFLSKSNDIHKENLISYLNLDSDLCYNNGKFISDNEFFWDNATVTEYELTNIGFTGLDNGLLPFRRDIVTNAEFLEIYQNSKYTIGEYGANLVFHPVSGGTNQYVYPYAYDVEKKVLKLNGGFLQTCFETQCEKYRILPDKLDNGEGLCFEFVLKPIKDDDTDNSTLNKKYPNNKGIFFYIGTRAENKWVYLYEKDDISISYDDYIEDAEINKDTFLLDVFLDMSIPNDLFDEDNTVDGFSNSNVFENDDFLELIEDEFDFGLISENKLQNNDNLIIDEIVNESEVIFDSEYVSNEINIIDFIYRVDDTFTIGVYEYYKDYSNPFLLLNRTCDGFNVNSWSKDTFIRYVGIRNTFNENLFLLMNRTCTGYTVNNIDELKTQYDKKYDVYKDLYENALSFRITDDGEIGYKYLVKDCTQTPTYKIEEGYSKKGIVKLDEWHVINVKITAYYNDMILRFYVNGKLIFISKPLPKLNLRELDDLYEKQECVPFNISLGGGTQGLSETILPNYMLDPYRLYPLEKHFGGSFIGEIKSFKIYNELVNYENILNNFIIEMGRINEK